jgi:hypothetical protein
MKIVSGVLAIVFMGAAIASFIHPLEIKLDISVIAGSSFLALALIWGHLAGFNDNKPKQGEKDN